MDIANDPERIEQARRLLADKGASEELIQLHLAALVDTEGDPARRRWHREAFNERIIGLVPLEDVPDLAAYRSFLETVLVDRLHCAGTPADFLRMSFDDIKPRQDVKGFAAALAACRDFAENITDRLEAGAGIVLCGNPGCGKSMLAALEGRAARETGASVRFVRVRAMLDQLKDWENAADFRERIEAVDLLVLDDLAAEYQSDWTRSEVDAVVSTRHAECRSIIVTSNLSPGELAKAYSPRVIDRLRERGPALELRGPSWRARK